MFGVLITCNSKLFDSDLSTYKSDAIVISAANLSSTHCVQSTGLRITYFELTCDVLYWRKTQDDITVDVERRGVAYLI